MTTQHSFYDSGENMYTPGATTWAVQRDQSAAGIGNSQTSLRLYRENQALNSYKKMQRLFVAPSGLYDPSHEWHRYTTKGHVRVDMKTKDPSNLLLLGG